MKLPVPVAWIFSSPVIDKFELKAITSYFSSFPYMKGELLESLQKLDFFVAKTLFNR